VIFDFEDAVAPEMKTVARELAQAALASGGYGRREMVIRTNAPGSVWFEDDLAMAARSGADAVLIPKVSDPADLARVGARLGAFGAPERLRVWAMIETARSILRAEALAACAHDPEPFVPPCDRHTALHPAAVVCHVHQHERAAHLRRHAA
jgi:citrate lyase subunit beta/citryl-CoA lyase